MSSQKRKTGGVSAALAEWSEEPLPNPVRDLTTSSEAQSDALDSLARWEARFGAPASPERVQAQRERTRQSLLRKASKNRGTGTAESS